MEFQPETPMLLLDALAQIAPDSSKSTLRSWIKLGRVAIDGIKAERANQQVKAGSRVVVLTKRHREPEGITILYRDQDVVVIDKPTGLLSVATDSGSGESAHSKLKQLCTNSRVFPVHRLDRETSGVLVFALNETARDHLKEQFADRSITRRYVAVATGNPPSQEGTWKSYLWEEEDMTVHSQLSPGRGKLAITHYRMLQRRGPYCLLELKLETGRKHQIRVHCASADLPISGDARYGGRRASRLCLHARLLGFTHPTTGKRLEFESPIPPLFIQLTSSRNA